MPTETWQTHHDAFTPGHEESAWLGSLRRRALARVGELGFPTTRDEGWRYTSTRALQETPWVHAKPGPVDVIELVDSLRIPHAAAELVFVDGRLVPGLSRLPQIEGVVLLSMADALRTRSDEVRERLGQLAPWEQETFTALNVAFLQDGLYLSVGRNVALPGPVHVVCVAASDKQPVVSHLRNLVLAEPGSRATVVETHAGRCASSCLSNVVDEVHVAANADVTWHVLGVAPETVHLVHTLETRLDRDARFRGHLTWLGGAITRSNVRITHAGEGAEAWLDGITILGGRQHVDNHTVIDHTVPRCTTRESYKAVLGGNAKGVFDGLIVVRQDAQHTDSTQDSRNLLLSDSADANAKPTLEIYADDVKCAHGTTVGQLDAQQLWYLRSRGIPEALGRKMLTAAFIADRVEQVKDDGLRERLRVHVEARLTAVQEDA